MRNTASRIDISIARRNRKSLYNRILINSALPMWLALLPHPVLGNNPDIRDVVDATAPADDQNALGVPPLTPLREPTAWSSLQDAVAEIASFLKGESAGGRHGNSFHALARASLRSAEEGLRDLVRVETDFAGTLDHVKRSVRKMAAAQSLVPTDSAAWAFAEKIQKQLALIGARLAEDGIARARSAGLDAARLAAAEEALRRGSALVAAGAYVPAFDGFGPGIIVGNLPHFSLDRYEENIRDAFEGQVVGYQYAIAVDGQLERTGSDGVARTGADPAATPQSPFKEMNIASVSKTITATVLVQLLEDRNVSVDSSISPWLPSSWNPDPSIDQLTFRDLLTHCSGLNQNLGGPYDFDSLRTYIEAGVVEADKGDCIYQNGNFALFRVAIPYLRFGASGVEFIGAPLEEVVAGLYIGTVRDYAFNPTGFIEADCEPNDPAQTLLYRFPDDGSNGVQNGDWSLLCGSGGWYMSTVELVGFMANRRFTNNIMTPTARNLMDANFLGWMDPANYNWGSGLYGIYRNHGGDLWYDPEPLRGLDACIMEYPSGVQTAILINSNGGSYAYQCQELHNAYDNAFVIP